MKYPMSGLQVVDDDDEVWTGQELRWMPRDITQCWATGQLNWNAWRREMEDLCCMETGDFTKTLGLCPGHYEEIIG